MSKIIWANAVEALLDIETTPDRLVLDVRNGDRPDLMDLVGATIRNQATLATVLRELISEVAPDDRDRQ